MSRLIIGREPDPTRPRIVLSDKSVSRNHAELSRVDGQLFLEDLKSSNGTFVREKGGWRRITRECVRPEDEVRLGAYTTTVRTLLEEPLYAPARSRIERNPETGEIILRPERR
jgi:pSer/pThr/pTyr-binding forkhead associated (FHA) protein